MVHYGLRPNAPYVPAFTANKKVIPHPSGRPDNAGMTRAHLRANRIGPPSLSQPLLAALLRVFAMLLSFAANFFRMRPSRLSRECHVDVTPATLPQPESGNLMETEKPAASSQTTAHSQLTCAPPTPPTTAPVFPPIARPTRTRTGRRTRLRIGGWNSVWNCIANPIARLRTDITRI